MFIYCPINIDGPIGVKKSINIQNNTFSNYPDIIIELHNHHGYVDLGDDCSVSAAVTNTDLESSRFFGSVDIINPHRGQIKFSPSAKDFTVTGINTLTVLCDCGSFSFSFQFTVFIQSLSKNLFNILEGV